MTFGLGFTGIDALTRGGDAWFGSAELVLATLSGVALIWRSNAQPRPLAPIDLLKNKLFAMSVVTSIASFSAQMLAFVSLPFYLQGILHRSQVETGLLMTPWPVAAGVAAFIAGQLADKFCVQKGFSKAANPRRCQSGAAGKRQIAILALAPTSILP